MRPSSLPLTPFRRDVTNSVVSASQLPDEVSRYKALSFVRIRAKPLDTISRIALSPFGLPPLGRNLSWVLFQELVEFPLVLPRGDFSSLHLITQAWLARLIRLKLTMA